MGWEAERNGLSNDSWVAEKNLAGNGSGIPAAMGPVPPFILYYYYACSLTLRFNREVLSRRYKRPFTDALDRVEPWNIKMCLIFCIKSSRAAKQRLHPLR